MELFAVISGLQQLKERCHVTLYTDSAYVVNAFLKGWILSWQLNGWKTAKKTPVENQDLWKELLNLTKDHTVRWEKVQGHADNAWNNRCDMLAREQIRLNQLESAE